MELWNFGRAIGTGLVLIVTALVLLLLFLNQKYKYWTRKGIKSPTLWETVKSWPEGFRTPFHKAVVKMYTKYGRFFGLYGPLPQLWIAEPDILKQILVKDFHMFRNRMKMDFDIGEGLFQKMLSTLCDDDWKRVRCIVSPTFSSSKIRKMAILVKECANNATAFFLRFADKDEEFDIKKHFGSFSVDVIATTAFATKIDSLHDPDNEFLVNARNLTNRDVSILKSIMVALFPRLAKWLKIELFPLEPLIYYRRLVKKILEEREKTRTKGSDFLQLMMDAREDIREKDAEDDESNDTNEDSHLKNTPKQYKTLTMEEVICQCLLFFLAGHDTTSTTLSFVAYHLALNPDCQEKLAEEVKSTWEKHGDLDFDIVSKMPYLEAVIYETLRINSTASVLLRLSADDYTVENTEITIPKGTSILIPVYAMHLDPEWFPNPEQFDPERFLPENKHLIKPFTYLPFGDGPRNCIGMRFVMMVMKLCLCYLLKDLRFVATEQTRKPLEYYFGQGVVQTKRVPLKVEKR